MISPEQFIDTQKAHLDAINDTALKMFGDVEKLAQLNLATAKTLLEDGQANARALLSAKDAQELVALQADMAQPLMDKTLAWGRAVYDIAAKANEDFGKTVQGQFEAQRGQMADFVDQAIQQAPVGSEAASTLLQNAIDATNGAVDSLQKAVWQANDMAVANVNAATQNMTTTSKKATKASTKKS